MQNDNELRRLFARLSDEEARRGSSCPATGELVAYVLGGLGEPEREGLESHLSDCGFCLGQLRFALRSGELGPEPAVPLRLLQAVSGSRPRGEPRARRPALAWLAAAAGLALVVVAVRFGAFELPPSTSGPGAQELEGAGREVRGLEGSFSGAALPVIVQPGAGHSVNREALTVAWEPVPDALGYVVQVMDSRGNPLWELRTEASSTSVPREVELVPGDEHYVWVTAQLRSGLRARSPASAFRVVSE